MSGSSSTTPARLVVWADPDQATLIRDAATADDIELIGVGCDAPGAGTDLAREFGIDRVDDIRAAVQHSEADVLWIAGGLWLDTAMFRLIDQVGRQLLTTEPQPGSIGELAAVTDEAAAARVVPLFRRSPGYRAAMSALDEFGSTRGPVQCINIALRSGLGEGSLFARLYDAMDVVVALCGDPDILDAAFVGETGEVPETLGRLRGHMTVNLRFPENRCACIAISNRAGGWFRGVTVLGENGCLRINDDGFEWVAPDGRIVDSQHTRRLGGPGSLVAVELQRWREHLDHGDVPLDHARLLALCETARLSCRTGAGEAPTKVLRMLKRP